VFRFDLGGGTTTELQVGDAESLAVTPDGRRLAALSAFTKIQGVHDIAVFDLDPVGELGTVPGGAQYQAEMSWHPNGGRLAFSDRSGWVSEYDLDRRIVRHLVAGSSPAWSPSGLRLAFRRGERAIMVREADGSIRLHVRRWFFRPPFIGSMEWSPDGRWLAVTSLAGGVNENTACDVLRADDGAEVASYPDVSCGGWLQLE
jgi:Tol biopolymer transport system component